MKQIEYKTVTLILPVRNEEQYIARCLQAVITQDYPAELTEIIVADGNSIDRTRQIVQQFQSTYPNISLIDNPGKIVPTGMNAALRRAQGDIIIRVDGHCVIAPDYVRKCVEHLLSDHVDGVGGSMVTKGEDRLSESIAASMSSAFGVGGSAFRTVTGKTMLVDTVPFAAYPMSLIRKTGLYDEELIRNQDDEYNYRVRATGGKILLADDVRSVYYSRGSLRKLWKQYYQYGFFKVRVLQKHPRQMSMRQFIPPLFVTALIASLLLLVVSSQGRQAFTLVAGSYLLANLGASVITAAKYGWQHVFLLPVCFAILHLGYGLGFLVGLVKFRSRWRDREGKTPDWEVAA